VNYKTAQYSSHIPVWLGMLFARINWTIHRLDVINEKLRKNDYELVNESFIRHYQFDNINAVGSSCYLWVTLLTTF